MYKVYVRLVPHCSLAYPKRSVWYRTGKKRKLKQDVMYTCKHKESK